MITFIGELVPFIDYLNCCDYGMKFAKRVGVVLSAMPGLERTFGVTNKCDSSLELQIIKSDTKPQMDSQPDGTNRTVILLGYALYRWFFSGGIKT